MSLPYIRGYPIVFSIATDIVNEGFKSLAAAGVLPTQWHTTGDSWELGATLEPAFITLDPSFPQSIRLNFPVKTGEFKAIVRGRWVPYKLDGVIFRFLTPTRLLHETHSANASLTVQSLFLDLDSPRMETIVDTSKQIDTRMPDGHIRVALKDRITAYIKELAQKDKTPFIISTSVAANAVATPGGCLQPSSADYSTYAAPPTAVNWLFKLPYTATPNSPEAGHFDSNPLNPGGGEGVNRRDAAMRIAGAALIRCLVLPAVEQSMGIPASSFTVDATTSSIFSLRGHVAHNGWLITKANIYPNGDHIQCDFSMRRTSTVSEGFWIFKVKESMTVDVNWETHISFSLTDGDRIVVTAVNKNKHVSHQQSGSILGIPVPSFLENIAADLAFKLTGADFRGFELQTSLSSLISQVRVLGGGAFYLQSVHMQDGNLVLGLSKSPYIRLSPSRLKTLRSMNDNQNTLVVFHNHTGETQTLHWIDYQGNMPSQWGPNQSQHPYVISNSNSLEVGTFVTHPFAVYNSRNQCHEIIRIEAAGKNNRMDIFL